MEYGYIGKIHSVKKLQEYITLFEQRGIITDNVVINLAFDEFVTSLNDEDTIVVYSYVGLFASLNSYMSTAIKLIERGIVIESLLELHICINRSNSELVSALNVLNRQFHSSISLKGIDKAKAEGKKLGRPRGSTSDMQKKVQQIDKLCKESNIPISEACIIAGCLPVTYYRIKGQMKDKIKQVSEPVLIG